MPHPIIQIFILDILIFFLFYYLLAYNNFDLVFFFNFSNSDMSVTFIFSVTKNEIEKTPLILNIA